MNKSHIYAIAVFCTIAFSACDKQLSEPPANAKVDGTVITDQKSAQVALNGAYYRFANVNSNNITDWINQNVSGGMLAGTLTYAYGEGYGEQVNNNANTQYVDKLWSPAYQLVNATNGVIEGINGVADNIFAGNRKKEIIAEAMFLRAYGNFKLLMYFSEWNNINSKNGVLLRTSLSTLGTAAKARSSVAESYDAILSDLDYGIANGPTANPNHYMNKWAASVLKMRVLICRAQAGDYAKVIAIADDVLQNSPYVLETNLKDIFYAKGLASTEVILGTKPQANQEGNRVNLSFSYYPGNSSLYVATKKYKDLLAGDPRGTWMVAATSDPFAQPDTYYFNKFIPLAGVPSQLTETCYGIRLTEVYLLKAEAIIRSAGDLGAARELIKKVQEHAGVTNFKPLTDAASANLLLLENYKEVLRNFTGEDGIEWMTLIRLPLSVITQEKPTITLNQQLYFPVPMTEFDLNPKFGDQNTGYSKN
ncbi:SusD family protein [compost metagenome]